MGPDHDQLLPDHHGHPGPVRYHPVQVVLRCRGEETVSVLVSVKQVQTVTHKGPCAHAVIYMSLFALCLI